MTAVLRHSWALLLGMFLLMLGNGLQGTLLGVRGSLESIDTATMGYIMSAYFAGFLIGSRATPWMIQRVGHVRVFAALGSLVSAAFILYAARVDPLAWTLLRLLVGFCFSGIYVVAESWLNDSSTNETRGQALSLYMIVQASGMLLGQLLLNAADPAGYGPFVLITVLVSLSIAPMLLSSSPAPPHTRARPMPLGTLIRTSPLATVGVFLMGGVFSTLYGMTSVYATQSGFTIRETSFLATAIVAGGLAFQYPIGWLSDRVDRRVLIIMATGLGALVALVPLLVELAPLELVGCLFLVGGLANPLYALLIAYANDHLELEQMASASGGLIFLNGLGATAGPIIVGALMSRFGTLWFFVSITLLFTLICLYGIYRSTRRPHLVVAGPAPYLPISARTGYVATEMAIETADEAQLEALEEDEEVFEARLHERDVLERAGSEWQEEEPDARGEDDQANDGEAGRTTDPPGDPPTPDDDLPLTPTRTTP